MTKESTLQRPYLMINLKYSPPQGGTDLGHVIKLNIFNPPKKTKRQATNPSTECDSPEKREEKQQKNK